MLVHLFQQKKELKLSILTKDVGFQLLSEEFEIKAAEALSSQPEMLPDQVLELSAGILERNNSDDEQKLQRPGASNSVYDEDYKSTDAASFLQVNENNLVSSSQSAESIYSATNEALVHARGYALDWKFEEEILAGTDKKKQQKHFSGSFFFCDVHFRLLEALTALSRIPSVVIIDPIVLQHYVYVIPENNALNYFFLSDFLGDFLNGSLTPYQQSEPVVQKSREVPLPPFVNLDFLEADSIPWVTVNTFAELVLGNQFDSENSGNTWDRDVLVLFRNNCCGYCQWMELIVHEVYRAIKSYTMMLKSGMGNENFLSRNGKKQHQMLILLCVCVCAHSSVFVECIWYFHGLPDLVPSHPSEDGDGLLFHLLSLEYVFSSIFILCNSNRSFLM